MMFSVGFIIYKYLFLLVVMGVYVMLDGEGLDFVCWSEIIVIGWLGIGWGWVGFILGIDCILMMRGVGSCYMVGV